MPKCICISVLSIEKCFPGTEVWSGVWRSGLWKSEVTKPIKAFLKNRRITKFYFIIFFNFIATVQFSFRIHFFRNSDSKCIKLHIFNSGCCYLFNENLYIKFICQFWQQCYCWKVCWEISLWSVSAVTCIIPVQWEALKLIWSNICFEYNI